MLIQDFLDKQKKLDSLIADNCHNRGDYSREFANEKLLALQVEIGEFESEREPAAKIAEYIDILHFLLSLANTLKIHSDFTNKQFENIYSSIKKFKSTNTLSFFVEACQLANSIRSFKYWSVKPAFGINYTDKWICLFMTFLRLGLNQKYTSLQIENAYTFKYLVNIGRQEERY